MPRDAFSQEYGKLVGKTVKRVVRDGPPEGHDTCYGLEFDNGATAWIQCDPEGNGPGFLQIAKKGE